MDLKELNPDVTINHWYYNTKFLFLRQVLNKNYSPSSAEIIIADIGAGSGIFTKAFLNSFPGKNTKAYAVDKFYTPEFLGTREGICFMKNLPEGINPTHFLFLDVLEHIEDDAEFLKNWVKIAPSKSCFLFSVPALPYLWSSHDEFLSHKRRYRLKEFERIITTCGLEIKTGCYFFMSILPMAFLSRKAIDPILPKSSRNNGIKKTNPILNFLLKLFLKIETRIGVYNRFCGLSCVVFAVKP